MCQIQGEGVEQDLTIWSISNNNHIHIDSMLNNLAKFLQ